MSDALRVNGQLQMGVFALCLYGAGAGILVMF